MANSARARQLDGVRILLVEDDATAREALTALLQIEGADVTMTASGREALDLAVSGSFDLLITDLDLPDVPGDAVIRSVVATAHVRVIVITGSSERAVSRARDAGADVVLTKPIDWPSLIGHVRSACPAAAA
jgi:DNA-binding response OmpR family regulator